MPCVLDCADEAAATWGFLGITDQASGRCIGDSVCECAAGYYTVNTYGQPACVSKAYTDGVLGFNVALGTLAIGQIVILHAFYLMRGRAWPPYRSRTERVRGLLCLIFAAYDVVALIGPIAYLASGIGMDVVCPAVMVAEGLCIAASFLQIELWARALPEKLTRDVPLVGSLRHFIQRYCHWLLAGTAAVFGALTVTLIAKPSARLMIEMATKQAKPPPACAVAASLTLPTDKTLKELDARPILQFQPLAICVISWQVLIITLIVQPTLLASSRVVPSTPSGSFVRSLGSIGEQGRKLLEAVATEYASRMSVPGGARPKALKGIALARLRSALSAALHMASSGRVMTHMAESRGGGHMEEDVGEDPEMPFGGGGI
ncbi:hypothetical protein JKP88DRAFT_281914 [Tribonema minus]|uniref:Uncharacterized protein n=1 Tax=Tribonema minus TaxID=303371 RepID=A0A835YN64_9STRA|nr:hypothetical protein JKP88DRAFT_281914 [Tribonema minus]